MNADVHGIRVSFIDQPDPHFGPMGARGLGELPLTGAAAAVANAVFNATGIRLRDLPILPEKLRVGKLGYSRVGLRLGSDGPTHRRHIQPSMF